VPRPTAKHPRSIKGRDDRGRRSCIGNHRPPFGAAIPCALRSAAIALLDVRPASMQRSMCGRSASACAAAKTTHRTILAGEAGDHRKCNRSSSLATVLPCQRPPRGVATLRLVSSSAIFSTGSGEARSGSAAASLHIYPLRACSPSPARHCRAGRRAPSPRQASSHRSRRLSWPYRSKGENR
jgi:hypothetical protein